MSKVLDFLKVVWATIVKFFSKTKVNGTEGLVDMSKEDSKYDNVVLLSPTKHWRYISLYCIADLSDGSAPIKTTRGDVIWQITDKSLERLIMEGTGRLSDGRVVNVDRKVGGEWRYKVMGPDSPHGVGIRGKALVPWVSVAHHLQQLRTHSLFGRKIVIPSLRGFKLPNGDTHDGCLEVADTGEGLRKCPYFKGLWRTGDTKAEYGQFDLFIGGPESVYKELLGTWNSYREVIVMPRDTETGKGVQETLNLLLDAGLKIDGIHGPKTKEAISRFQSTVGLEVTEVWDDCTKEVAEKSLSNWDESL